MELWRLTEGLYTKENITEDEIWQVFNYIFSTKSVNRTSHKFRFLKALLENVFSIQQLGEVTLTQLFTNFTKIYWFLIVKYN